MKKIICLLLAAVVLLLSVGCNQQEPIGETEPIVEARKTYRPEKKEYDNSPFSSGYYNVFDTSYQSFEACLKNTTDIFKATFLGTVKDNTTKYFFFDFEINEIIKGELDGNTVTVCVNPANYSGVGCFDEIPPEGASGYNTNSIPYGKTKSYLLLLSRRAESWNDTDWFIPIHNSLVIPLDENGKPDIQASKMYGIDLLSNILSKELKESVANGNLINAVLENTKNNPKVIKVDGFIDETDPITVMTSATYVLVVEIKAKRSQSIAFNGSEAFDYKVIKSIKGEPTREIGVIRASSEKLKVGEQYVIAFSENYSVISRNAIFPYTE